MGDPGWAASDAVSQVRHSSRFSVRRVGVLGAGTMGSRIAGLLADAGVPVVMLDLPAKEARAEDRTARSKIAVQALEALKNAKPPALFENSAIALITPGNYDDHLRLLEGCDWIIEAVSENLE